MKKRIVCGTAAIVLTGLSFSIFTLADNPRQNSTQHSGMRAAVTDATSIDRGRYIIKTAGCNDCHTAGYAQSGGTTAEQQWLTGDSLGYQGAWGVTYPINLRLFMQSITADQWLAIARQPARPPMPWFALRDMTDTDLLAIYEYIRSLGPKGEHAPAYLAPGSKVSTPTVDFPG